MKSGRKKGPPTVSWELEILASTAAKLELILLDPLTNKARYGIRSQLLNALIEKWLAGEIDLPINQWQPTKEHQSGSQDPSHLS